MIYHVTKHSIDRAYERHSFAFQRYTVPQMRQILEAGAIDAKEVYKEGTTIYLRNGPIIFAVSYTHLTLPTNREV